MLVGLSLLLAMLVVRLVVIHTALRDRLVRTARIQQRGSQPLPSRRGYVFDRNGRVLAGTRYLPSVFADPGVVGDRRLTAATLAPVVDVPEDRLVSMLDPSSGRRFRWVQRFMSPDDARVVEEMRLRGVRVRWEAQRLFPMGAMASNLIGVVGAEGRGLEGLELQYDAHLSGQDGVRAAVYDGRRNRRPIWFNLKLSRSERDGGHIVLTIDSVIQGIVEEEIERVATDYEAEAAVGVVMDPNTGALLAMAQYPTFDPNAVSESKPSERRNRVVCDAVEPGSIFKPFVAAGALLRGLVDPEEKIFCHEGLHYFDGRKMRDVSPHGWLTIRGIIAKSSNIGMGIIGTRMGDRAIYETVRSFGFGSPTGIEFPGEAAGILRALDDWTSYSKTSIPIGQEIAVTPLQLVTGFSALVNGGLLMKPYLVRVLLDAEGRHVRSLDGPQVVRRVLPEALSRYMTTEILTAVIEAGGRAAGLDAWQVAGKTGTAQVPYRDRGGYEPEAYIGSFLGAAPAEDPVVVVLVMVIRPDASIGYYGGRVAAPAAGHIFGRVLTYLRVPPDEERRRSILAGFGP